MILPETYAQHNGANFLYPTDLVVEPLQLNRVAIIGSCFMQAFRYQNSNPSGCRVDLFVANNAASLPAWPGTETEPAPYDFQIVQIGLRFVAPDSIWRLPYDDPESYQKEFAAAVRRLKFQLQLRMGWNQSHGLLTFVCNFTVPQRNPMGAMFPRYDLRNPEHFVQRLNEALEDLVAGYREAYVLDIDRVAASFGRRHIQDDLLAPFSHGSVAGIVGPVTNRIETVPPVVQHYPINWNQAFSQAVWNEAIGMCRTRRDLDAVKLVVVDLDDTLWTGTIGEMEHPGPDILAGWQNALAEALRVLKHRGILLAIISKNDEGRVKALWAGVFGEKLRLEDFAAVKINWQPKPENMSAVLAAVKLLPQNVVFIDDNPAERDAMTRAFPGLRVLGRHPLYLRHTLLWSAETQVAAMTDEGARRTAMVQAQIRRETDKTAISQEDFLRAAAPAVRYGVVRGMEDARFARVQELVGKTNQFNTTGRRWNVADYTSFFQNGGTALTFTVSDSYTQYGLVGAILAAGGRIEQFVMSCRVLGYGVEQAALAYLVAAMREKGVGDISARLVETEVNFPCREVFAKAGFRHVGQDWVLAAGIALEPPAWVKNLGDEAAVPC